MAGAHCWYAETRIGQGYGKADIGGPFVLLDQNGKVMILRTTQQEGINRRCSNQSLADSLRHGLSRKAHVHVLRIHILSGYLPQRNDENEADPVVARFTYSLPQCWHVTVSVSFRQDARFRQDRSDFHYDRPRT